MGARGEEFAVDHRPFYRESFVLFGSHGFCLSMSLVSAAEPVEVDVSKREGSKGKRVGLGFDWAHERQGERRLRVPASPVSWGFMDIHIQYIYAVIPFG